MRPVKNPDFRITKLEHARQIMRSEIQAERIYIEGMKVVAHSAPKSAMLATEQAQSRIKLWQHALSLLADVTEV